MFENMLSAANSEQIDVKRECIVAFSDFQLVLATSHEQVFHQFYLVIEAEITKPHLILSCGQQFETFICVYAQFCTGNLKYDASGFSVTPLKDLASFMQFC